ncbi:MAG: sulfite exporter TauE/SafE family protein [bacterium]
MSLALAGRALALGFSTGLFCIGFCVPVLGPVLLARGIPGRPAASLRDAAASLGLFLAGRLTAYLAIGLLFGTLGRVLSQAWLFRARVLPGLYLLLGLMMVAYALVQSFPHLGFCRLVNPGVRSRWYLLLLGLLAGLHLCPPSLLAAAAAAETGGPLAGMLFFLLFFLASSIYMLPLLFAGVISRFEAVRFAARLVAVLAGGWFVYLAIRTLVG